jgi:excinuclease UvrABC nuclease subunit
MDKFSVEKNYEKAAIYRDRVSALRDIQRSQSVTGYNDPEMLFTFLNHKDQ